MICGIVAVAENGVIGDGNRIPWNYPNDLQRFRAKTMGGVVVMGRNTFESLGRKPLKGRTNVVLTRDTSYKAHPDVVVLSSREEVLEFVAYFSGDVWIMGGNQIYHLFKDDIQSWDVTFIPERPEGDVYITLVSLLAGFYLSARRVNADGSISTIYSRIS